MSEFGELTPAEIRILREHRANEALKAHPTTKPLPTTILDMLITALAYQLRIGRRLDPENPVWRDLCRIFEEQGWMYGDGDS